MTWWMAVQFLLYGRVGQIIGIVSLRTGRKINSRWLKNGRDSFRITPTLPNHQKQPTKWKGAVTYPRPRDFSVLSVSEKGQGSGNSHAIQVLELKEKQMGEFIWRRRHLHLDTTPGGTPRSGVPATPRT
ncbi:hypothetical protein ASPSYDRAFT_642043 [Aspergillus sydowii CBS 593.65]|uniref:Uncharacterized protein n=1 Tax=Aspergillus sydowii CBS 593.65 TaxID=1036612 RepID=A0A1L9TSZ3_9EURO|nr:uncharacterized protein ASPSYDRAFT_642043 [Aspergillus sydowii CBS 593.65]OJJ62403.1 hypothetical protein ASPSYDRAFT_642043 [Aspergillus sydowii CBS 593.65]